MTEGHQENKLRAGKNIERDLTIPDLTIKNHVDYLRAAASEKSTFAPCCGCIGSHLEVSPSFNRAFKTLTMDEKADFYFKTVSVLKKCLDGEYQQEQRIEQGNKQISLYFFNESESNWEARRIDLNYDKKGFRFLNGGEEIDLHYYLMRNSKKKDRQSLALESTQKTQTPTTIRVSYNRETFEELKSLFQRLVLACIQEEFVKKLSEIGKLPPMNKPQTEFKLLKVTSSRELEPVDRRDSAIEGDNNGGNIPINGLEQEKNKLKIINSLRNYAGLRETTKNTFVDTQDGRVRKIYQVNEEDYAIPLEWYSDNLMSASSFRSWKKSLREARCLSALREEYQEKVFFQEHQFKEQVSASYLYKRERHESTPDLIYFFDAPVEESRFSKIQANSKIEYVVWKFQRTGSFLTITIEGKISHALTKSGSLSISLTDQFLGDINRICSKQNVTMHQDSNFLVNTAFFEDLYLSEFGEGNIAQNNDDSFFSIISNDQQNQQNQQAVPSSLIKAKSHKTETLLPTLKSIGSISGPLSSNRLKWKHPMNPFVKSSTPKYRFPQEAGKNPFWQDEFKFNDKGEMICINIPKMDAQKGILMSLAKSVGRSIFAGKSLLSISMPVTIFSKQSNLSLLCKSYCYAPKILQKAAQQTDPQARFKHAVAFSLGCSNAYIRMDKPFNPILGETFHGLVDGCPVYGQQTHHHPPISSIIFKGRGYTIHGSFEAKVSLSVNSAKGSNQGITHVSFDDQDMNKKIFKYNSPAGEVGGIMWGDRTIKCVNKPQYLDVDNRLFLELTYAKHKGTTQFCKYQNGVEGKLVKLRDFVDLSTFPHIKVEQKDIEKSYGVFSGKWTEFLFYDDDQIFNFCEEYPHLPEKYPCPLESDAFYRSDLLLRGEQKMEESQTAKEELQEIQRNDRKLRKKYTEG